jgi:hypothetical protein
MRALRGRKRLPGRLTHHLSEKPRVKNLKNDPEESEIILKVSGE